jgi:hypothetical protein
MKLFGWVVLILGLLGCIFAGFVGAATLGQESSGLQSIGIAIAALGGVHAGLTLIEWSQSN